MHTPTANIGSDHFVQQLKTTGLRPVSSSSAEWWPAPAPKQNSLVLRSSGGRASPLPESVQAGASSTTTPFPSPVRAGAFDLPRPVISLDPSSPWALPSQKLEALMQRRANVEKAEEEFMRPHFFGEKLSARHPWQRCRSC